MSKNISKNKLSENGQFSCYSKGSYQNGSEHSDFKKLKGKKYVLPANASTCKFTSKNLLLLGKLTADFYARLHPINVSRVIYGVQSNEYVIFHTLDNAFNVCRMLE